MAILKDTLIQGSARVTDTLYANTVSADTLSADDLAAQKLTIDYAIDNAANNTQGLVLKYQDTDKGHLGINNSGLVGLYATGSIAIRPDSTLNTSTDLWSATTGIQLTSTAITPSGSISLGTSSAKWSDLYSSAATLNELSVVGGDTVIATASGHGATPKLIFQRGTATDQYSNWKLYNDSVGVLTLQVYHSGLTGDTDIIEILPPTSGGQIPTIQPGATNSYDFGTSSLVWRNIYATTLHGALALSEITGATNLQAIEALTGTEGILKKTSSGWTLDTTAYSTLTLGSTAGAALAASGSAGTATTAARSDHVHPFPTAANVGAATSDHTHGNITNGGCITTAITVASGDYLIVGDTSDSGKLGKGPAFVATTANKFLKDTGAFIAIASADLPNATTNAKGAVIVGTGLGVSSGTISVAYGTTADTACEGNDSRLSDARTPTSHNHGIIDNDGVLKNTSNSNILANRIPYSNTSGELATTADLVYTYSNRTLYSRVLAASYYSNSANNTGYGINFIDTSNSDAIMAHIGASTSGLGIYHGSSIYIRPALTGTTAGIVINTSSIIPSTHAVELSTANAMSLGITTNQWTSVFAKQYTVDTHVTLVYNSSDLSLNFNFS